ARFGAVPQLIGDVGGLVGVQYRGAASRRAPRAELAVIEYPDVAVRVSVRRDRRRSARVLKSAGGRRRAGGEAQLGGGRIQRIRLERLSVDRQIVIVIPHRTQREDHSRRPGAIADLSAHAELLPRRTIAKTPEIVAIEDVKVAVLAARDRKVSH